MHSADTDLSQTVVLAIGGYWYISDWPSKSRFVDENERAFINARLKVDSDATQDEAFTWSNVLDAVKDPKVWLYNLGYHTLSLPLYTLSLFLVRSTSSTYLIQQHTNRKTLALHHQRPGLHRLRRPTPHHPHPTPSRPC